MLEKLFLAVGLVLAFEGALYALFSVIFALYGQTNRRRQ